MLLDTNVILRFLLADHETLSPRAQTLFRRAAAGELDLLIPSLIAAECVYTLRSFYKLPKREITAALTRLLGLPGVAALEGLVLTQALDVYAASNVNLADAYLAALGQGLGYSIGSFDRDLKKLGAEVLE